MTVWCEDHKRSDCPHELTKLADELADEIARLTEQVRIAEVALRSIVAAHDGGDDGSFAWVVAEDALIQMSVVE